MSLINEMLRDLENRRAGELEKQDLQREVRPLPVQRGMISLRWWAAIGFMVLIAMTGLAVWLVPNYWSMESRSQGERRQTLVLSENGLPPASHANENRAEKSSAGNVFTENSLRIATFPKKPIITPTDPSRAETPSLKMTDRRTMDAASKIKPATVASMESSLLKAQIAAAANNQQGNIEKIPVAVTPRERAEAEYRRAQLLVANGESGAAQEALSGALKQDSLYSPARQSLVKLLLDARRIDDAMDLLQEGLDRQPAQANWAMSLARLQVEKGDINAAERTLARSRSYVGANAEYAGFLGHILNKLGRFREATEQYQIAVQVSPGDGRWWFGLGQALEGEGRHQDARSTYRNALETGNLNADLRVLAEQKIR